VYHPSAREDGTGPFNRFPLAGSLKDFRFGPSDDSSLDSSVVPR
jgi:hypothetical protein